MAQITAKEFAAKVGTDGRTARKFLRADAKEQGTETPGKGSRWAIEARSVKSLAKRFAAWEAARVAEDATDEVEATDAP